jgi:hypothetical protein
MVEQSPQIASRGPEDPGANCGSRGEGGEEQEAAGSQEGMQITAEADCAGDWRQTSLNKPRNKLSNEMRTHPGSQS